jgi:His-Xaa-Ser system radical SAM maturase HxsB
MRIAERRDRDEWIPNYYPSREIGPDQYLRISRCGKTVVLTKDEDEQLSQIFMDASLFNRLERTGHIVTSENSSRVFEELQTWLRRTYAGPNLHIVVLTKRCNLDCTFCHMDPVPVASAKSAYDMTHAMAESVVQFALKSPNPDLVFEFQGGEPFLNFSCLQYVVETAEKLNEHVGKNIRFVVVSNLMVAKDEELEFCVRHNIRISYSLNGPVQIHDRYRVTRQGGGSYLKVMDRIGEIRSKFPDLIRETPLCVIDSENAPRLREMIDFYRESGFGGLALIRLKTLGNARRNRLEFDMKQFLQYYLEGLDYIFEKNVETGGVFAERMLPVVLTKVLSDTDVGFVDWRNPCGDVTGALIYDYDGELLPADEARSQRNEFSLGNVTSTSYEQLIRRKSSFRTTNLSLRDRDPVCRECAYNPFCGVMPVLDFSRTGDPTPRPHESDECLFTLAVLDWTFQKLMTNPLPLFRMLNGMDEILLQMVADAATTGD